jgi:hypothetical protein
VWVDPVTGTVVRTHVRFTDYAPPSTRPTNDVADIDVTYQRVDALGMWLPAVMTEVYDGNPGGRITDRITTEARYSNYRTFQTSGRIK